MMTEMLLTVMDVLQHKLLKLDGPVQAVTCTIKNVTSVMKFVGMASICTSMNVMMEI